MATNKKRMGRPPVPTGIRRSVQHSISMTREEFAMLKSEAKDSGTTISEMLMKPWRKGKSE